MSTDHLKEPVNPTFAPGEVAFGASDNIAGMTLPRIVDYPAIPYFAVKARVTLPFDEVVPEILERLFTRIKELGLRKTGPIIFKHNLVQMPDLEMEFAVPVDRVVDQSDDFVSGMLPAGRYAEISYFGPYDDLITVNGVLIGWAKHSGIIFDSKQQADGEWFANRLEICHNSPEEEPDPRKLKTTVSIKIRD